MPPIQASMFKQLAKTKFRLNMIKLPTEWDGEPSPKQHELEKGDASASAGWLFKPETPIKEHVETAKTISQDFETYIDGISDAICSAWNQWRMAAMMQGVIVNAVTAAGGTVTGPPLKPLILATAPMGKPGYPKYNNAISSAIGDGWDVWSKGLKVPGLPWYPLFAAFPGPVAPPTPNVPTPLIAIPSAGMAQLMAATLKQSMISNLSDPEAPHHKQLFDAIADAFDKTFNLWLPQQQVMNVLGTGPIPTFAPPVAPVGPVVMGSGNSAGPCFAT